MNRIRVSVAACLVALAFAGNASAQLFNIDFSTTLTTQDGPAPGITYGAAAGQTGFWNNRTTAAATTTPLNDLSNLPTAATLTFNAGGSMGTFNGANSAATLANTNAEKLLDDGWDTTAIVGGGIITIANLLPGTYTIFVYGIAPDSTTALTGLSVVGGTPAGPISVGGALGAANSFNDLSPYPASPIAHAVFTKTIGIAENLVINVTLPTGSPFTTVNGLQITPEPGSLGLLALGALSLIKRRRTA